MLVIVDFVLLYSAGGIYGFTNLEKIIYMIAQFQDISIKVPNIF